jgi:group I intron endonuclease
MTKKKMVGVYCIENIFNGKKYIGYSTNIKNRWRNHKNYLKNGTHINNYLQNVYNKYGENIFKFYIIQELDVDENYLCLMEIYWIAYYDAYVLDGGGYNLTRGGEGCLGFCPSQDSRNKMSESGKGRKHTEETKKKMSENHWDNAGENSWWFGRHLTDEHKEHVAKSNIGKKKGKNKTSEHVGVSYVKDKNRWRARINIDKKRIVLGCFITEQEAIFAYESALKDVEDGIFEKKRGITSSYPIEKILEIKEMLENKIFVKEISAILGVSIGVIYKVIDGYYYEKYGISGISEDLKLELYRFHKTPIEIIVKAKNLLNAGVRVKDLPEILNISLSIARKISCGKFDREYNEYYWSEVT